MRRRAALLLAFAVLRPDLARAEDAPPPAGGRAGRGGGRGPGSGAPRGGPAGPMRVEVPAHDLDVVLGRPTRDGVAVSVRAVADAEVVVETRPAAGGAAQRSGPRRLGAGEPTVVELSGLAAGTAYQGRVLWRPVPGRGEPAPGPTFSFCTQRPPGAAFTFTVQADSHLDASTEPALYGRTLAAVAAATPDFHVDLGDTFMTDKYRDDFRAALPQYLAQRWWLGQAQVPVLLVLGNHDGEVGWRDTGRADDLPHWSLAQRKRLFPNPEPGAFYVGADRRDPLGGALQSAYAWTWGDALFVALDPFWPTRARRGRDGDGWAWTLGEPQYRALVAALAAHPARWRFVFTHHLVGGQGVEGRGGAEASRWWEWGGRTYEGGDDFAARRPGWPAPIHELLRRAGPTVVFHGHDHFYAHQERDGVVYQLVPQPGHPGGDAAQMAAAYGYERGDFLPSPGHVRVRVGPDAATVEYVRTGATPGAPATVAASYRVEARAGAGPAVPGTRPQGLPAPR